MTSMVSMTEEDGESGGTNPFDGDRIEVDESELRRVSHHQIFLGRVKRRIDELATRLTYGR